jgi:hypothetical protein
MSQEPSRLPIVLRWALESVADPDRCACDWITTEIVPGTARAAEGLMSPDLSLERLSALKSAYKSIRSGAATAAERNRAARLYAASIAVGLVRFETRISHQSDSALDRAFLALRDDDSMEDSLREMARMALLRAR